ncbi:MAG: hypothetical protein CVT49_08440 [candidate division Zixibacteria bacterium HGW-Zixibacteria-1]|nr:MAG: hypothetical protein CVT49_08440 [candidate division Zixibacteria bacterium HGW-Zixibacteria-1]
MKELLGKLTASLVETDREIPPDLIDKINGNIRPPARLTADDVYIRAMYIVSDQVNSHGGRFPADEHARLIELLIDSPVLIGHRKDSLPIARNFHAEAVVRDGANWVKVYFYWLKKGDKGEDLRKNIDAGIYKECSISFIFNLPECSICGSDIRQCRHRPLENYETDGGQTKQACFNYRQILKVLETSLVYRGSVRDTSITDRLFFDGEKEGISSEEKPEDLFRPSRRLWSFDRLDKNASYLMMPAYEAIRMFLVRKNGKVQPHGADGNVIESNILRKFISELKLPGNDFVVEGRLIGCCGKERQTVDEVVRYLNGKKSAVRRLDLKIIDLIAQGGENFNDAAGCERRKKLEELFRDQSEMLIPTLILKGEDISQGFGRCATRYGVEIFESNSSDKYLFTNHRRLSATVKSREKAGAGYRYTLACMADGKAADISDGVYAGSEWNEGSIVELEVCSIRTLQDKVELARPRIMGLSACDGQPDDIGLLLDNIAVRQQSDEYSLFRLDNDVILILNDKSKSTAYKFNRYDSTLLDVGRWFFAERVEYHDPHPEKLIGEGSVVDLAEDGDALRFSMQGPLNGDYLLRPAVKNGNRQFVFYKTNANKGSSEQGE